MKKLKKQNFDSFKVFKAAHKKVLSLITPLISSSAISIIIIIIIILAKEPAGWLSFK